MIIRRTTDAAGSSSNAMLGLSGMDTASMLETMMKPYKLPITVATQKQQIVTWRQERYRELIGQLQDFQSKYFDSKNATTNISSAGTWKQFSVKSSDADEKYVKITARPEASAGSGTLEVTKLPSPAKLTGRADIMKPVQGVTEPDWSENSNLIINMDGIERNIVITKAMADAGDDADAAELLQEALDAAFGVDMITVKVVQDPYGMGQNRLEFDIGNVGTGVVNQFIIGGGSARDLLGFGSGVDNNTPPNAIQANRSNKVVTTDTLAYFSNRMNSQITFVTRDAYNANGQLTSMKVVEFSINGTNFQFQESDSIQAVLDAINNSGAAKISYDNVYDRFTLEATYSGPGNSISVFEGPFGENNTDNSNFLAAIGFAYVDEDTTADGITTVRGGVIDDDLGQAITASNNAANTVTFDMTVNGVTKQIRVAASGSGSNSWVFMGLNLSIMVAFPEYKIRLESEQSPTNPAENVLTLVSDSDGVESAPWSISIVQSGGDTAISELMGLTSPSDPTVPTGLNAKLTTDAPTYTGGTFGRAVVNGTVYQLERDIFEVDGVRYELTDEPLPLDTNGDPEPVKITYTLTPKVDELVELVKGFVEGYNAIVEAISTALTEKRDPDYQPLTDEEREQLNDDEIEYRETKAKEGLLRGDTNFFSLASKLRTRIYTPIYEKYGERTTIGFGLENMGIDTKENATKTYNPADNGKLYITDEAVLREALTNNLDQVTKLFTKVPEEFYVPMPPQTEDDKRYYRWVVNLEETNQGHWEEGPLLIQTRRRYQDQTGGLATQFTNILDDYVSTYRGNDNLKGILIERAGVENDLSELTNVFTRDIANYDERIIALWKRYDMIEKEKIKLLSRLESVVANAGNQAAWMSSQMGQAQ